MGQQTKISPSKLKTGVLVFFFLIFFLPMLQQVFKVVPERKLEGVDNEVEFPVFSLPNWFDGKFQGDFEPALDINIGFRKTLIRIYGQINYWLFNTAKAGGVVIGKNDQIYVDSYIRAYTGEDYAGKTKMDLQIEKAKVVQEELKKKNIALFFAFAPGKGSFYPEFIPDRYLNPMETDSTNFDYYVNTMNKEGLKVLDLKNYFLKMKDTSTHRLFPGPGVHWSLYGSAVALDTISRYIAELKHIKTPTFSFSKFKVNEQYPYWGDYDASNLLNIFTVVPHKELPYIEIQLNADSGSVKPNVLIVGDSYYSVMEVTYIPEKLFSKSTYWLYDNRPSSEKDKPLDFRHEVEQRDAIMVLATDATLPQFPYSFINEAYEVYAPKNNAYAKLKDKEFRFFINETMKSIEKNKKWKKELGRSARERKISTIDQYIDVALWLYNEQEARNKKFVDKK